MTTPHPDRSSPDRSSEDPLEDKPGDALSAAILPVLMHQLNGATQVLTSLSAVLSMPGGERWLREKAGDMSSVSREIEDLGWLLAVLSTASGSNLLLTRREERGLSIMVEVVCHALRREGRDIAEIEGPPPKLAPGGGDGWELALALGLCLLEAGRALPVDHEAARGGGGEMPQLRWALGRHPEGGATLHLDGGEHSLEAVGESLLQTWCATLPGATGTILPSGELEFEVPAGWLLEPPLAS